MSEIDLAIIAWLGRARHEQAPLGQAGSSWFSPGRPGWSPTQAPHKSVLAQLTHTAPRFNLRDPLSVVVFVDTSTGSDAPAMFPSNGQLKRRPLHSAGSFGQVPPPQRYYGTLRLPAAHLAALRFLRLAIPSFVPCSSPPARDRAVDQPGVGKPGLQAGSHDGDGRVSQVPERPSCPCALFLDPGRTEVRQAIASASARPPLVSTTVAPASRRFRGSIARHWDSLSTLRSGGRPPPRKTRFRLLAKLCRAGFVNPQGCMKGFRVRVSSSLLELT